MSEVKKGGSLEDGYFMVYDEARFAGVMTYRDGGKGIIVIDHTIVPKEFGGRGLAGELVKAGVAFARKNKLKIVPECSYVRHKFSKDESIKDVLAS